MVIFTNWYIRYKKVNESATSYIAVNDFGEKMKSETFVIPETDLASIELLSLIHPLKNYKDTKESITIYTESLHVSNIVNNGGIEKYLRKHPNCNEQFFWNVLNDMLTNSKITLKFLNNGKNIFNSECRNLAKNAF